MAAPPTSSPTTSLHLLDSFGDSVMRGSEHAPSDYAFAAFDLNDYVSNPDVFAPPTAGPSSGTPGATGSNVVGNEGSSSASSTRPPQHGGEATVAMMTEALSQELEEMHSTGGSLHAPPHYPVAPLQHQRGAPTQPSLSSLRNPDGSSSSPHLNATNSTGGQLTPIAPAGSHSNDPTTELLKEQLSKQIQLQRLQHLQNQLLQHQIDLISGNNSNTFDPARLGFGGLLTPASSSEMRPMNQPDYVSPMLMQQPQQLVYPTQQDVHNAMYSLIPPNSTNTPPSSAHPNHLHQTMTAPASMVFYNSGQHTPNVDYFSPLTSPALGPTDAHAHAHAQAQAAAAAAERYAQDQLAAAHAGLPPSQFAEQQLAAHGMLQSSTAAQQQQQQQQQALQRKPSVGKTRAKRRSSVDEPLARKRQSPNIAPMLASKSRSSRSQAAQGPDSSPFLPPSPATSKRRSKSNASALNPHSGTVMMMSPSTQSGVSSSDGGAMSTSGAQNTPSPVDLDSQAMPPPAPPSSSSTPTMAAFPSSGERHALGSSIKDFMSPVTPGSIMNLGGFSRLSTSFSPSLGPQPNSEDGMGSYSGPNSLPSSAPISPLVEMASLGPGASGRASPMATDEPSVFQPVQQQPPPTHTQAPATSSGAGPSKASPAIKATVPATRTRASSKAAKAAIVIPQAAPPASTSSSSTRNRSSSTNISPAILPRNPGVSAAPRVGASPGLKPILPGGGADPVHLSLKSNYQNILEGRGKDSGIQGASGVAGFEGSPTASMIGMGTPGMNMGMSMGMSMSPLIGMGGFGANVPPVVKKTSHKAAEQKRRDSLKSGFDDLRILLPAITYDPEKDGENGERPAGSLPPRGPPRNMPGVANEHPNRGVSKLALLRAANEHIVRLQRRVDRRDDMMEKMRRELEALRLEVGLGSTVEPVDEEVEEDADNNADADADGDADAEDAAALAAGGASAPGSSAASTASTASTAVSSARKPMIWKDMPLVDLALDLDAIERDEEEERSARIAARPSEHLAKLAAAAGSGAG